MTEIVSLPARARSSVNLAACGHVEDLDLNAVGVELLERRADLAQQLGVVCPRLVEPEHGRGVRFSRARDGEPHPVLDRGVLGLAHAPDVAGVDLVLEQRLAVVVDDASRYPASAISNVLSCDPYSSAAWAISPMLGVVPIVAGSNAPCRRQSSTVSAYSAA